MKRAPDYQNPSTLKQPCNASLLKLARHVEEDLTFNQGVVGSNPTRLISSMEHFATILPPFSHHSSPPACQGYQPPPSAFWG